MILHCIVDLAYKYLVLSLVYHKIFSKTEKVLVFIFGGNISVLHLPMYCGICY